MKYDIFPQNPIIHEEGYEVVQETSSQGERGLKIYVCLRHYVMVFIAFVNTNIR